ILVSTMAIDAQPLPLFFDGLSSSQERILDLLPISGEPQSFVAAFSDQYFNCMGAAAFDGNQRRSNVLSRGNVSPPEPGCISELVPTGTPTLIYGYDGLTTGQTVSPIQVAGDGLHYAGNPVRGLASGYQCPLKFYRGLLYAANGTVSNVATGTHEGWFRSYNV